LIVTEKERGPKLDKKIFAALFFSIFAAVTGVGIVVPLLPVYAHDLGASGLYIGMIFGAFSLSRTFFLPYFGRLSDKKGRRPFIVIGLFGYALISLLFTISSNVESLIAIRFFQGIASAMIMPVVQAYIGEITPKGREGYVMGVFNMSMFIGLSLGPLMGGVIKDRYGLQLAFACMGALAVIGFLLSFLFLPPTAQERVVTKAQKPITWRNILGDRQIAGLFSFRFAYTACIGIIWGFLPVYADTKFALTSSAIGLLVMLGIFISGLIHVPMGYVADRINRTLLVGCGGSVVSLTLFSYALSGDFHGLIISSVIFGLGGGICMPALMAKAVNKGSDTGSMGTVMAILTMAHSMGMLTGSVLAGMMMDLFQLHYAFLLGAILMGLGTIFFLWCDGWSLALLRKISRGEEKPSIWIQD
jgi:MFS family permease